MSASFLSVRVQHRQRVMLHPQRHRKRCCLWKRLREKSETSEDRDPIVTFLILQKIRSRSNHIRAWLPVPVCC